jgi:hypothetical protein
LLIISFLIILPSLPVYRRFIHADVQVLCHHGFKPLIDLCLKKKKKEAVQLLQDIFVVAADLKASGMPAPADSKTNIKKKKAFGALPEASEPVPARACPPALAQLSLLRAAMTVLIDVQNPGGKAGYLREKEVPQEYVR